MLTDLIAAAAEADDARPTDRGTIKLGGIDPLGLRQINFELMDLVLPGLNNVTRHIRPYVVMAWAWRRAHRLVAARKGASADAADLRDFVDRIETIFVWSQFLKDGDADLPGGQALRDLLLGKAYDFGGKEWDDRRALRAYSTGLIAALNYGPSLRSMGWLLPLAGRDDLFAPPIELDPLLDDFEARLGPALRHKAFNQFGPVRVKRSDAKAWAGLWTHDEPEEIESAYMFERLGGAAAPPARQRGVALLQAAYTDLGEEEPEDGALRRRMADLAAAWNNPSLRPATADIWRRVQIRQLFRLALEGYFHWIVGKLIQQGSMTSEALALTFLAELPKRRQGSSTAGVWLKGRRTRLNPVDLLEQLAAALAGAGSLTAAIIDALAAALAEAPDEPEPFESVDRLPLAKAKRDTDAWANFSRAEFLVRIIERWIMAQHAYWAVGRGLAEARSRSETRRLRLKIVMDEGGWTLTPGVTKQGAPPEATPDRLRTAYFLLWECDQL